MSRKRWASRPTPAPESAIVPKIDEWLARLFDRDHIDETCKALAMADECDGAAEARQEAARLKVADCDRRLAKYRELLDHGAPPAIVCEWMEEVAAEREVAARDLPDCPPPEPLTPSQVKALAKGMKDILWKLATADPKTKAALYTGLGLKLTYQPETDVVEIEARPQDACATDGVGGGT